MEQAGSLFHALFYESRHVISSAPCAYLMVGCSQHDPALQFNSSSRGGGKLFVSRFYAVKQIKLLLYSADDVWKRC